METLFTRDEILQNVGCYSQEDVVKILKDKTEFTINEILSLDIPLKHKAWFICKRCELTDIEFSKFAIGCAWVVLPIFEAKYPENKGPREAIEAAEQYLLGTINFDILKQKLGCAYATGAYATNTNATTAAAYAAAYAADAAYAASADVSADSYATAAAAADAAVAVCYTKYQDLLVNFFKSFTE